MKLCINCKWHSRVGTQVAPGQVGMIDICSHEECRDPVTGDALPATVCRQSPVFCTFKGNYFEAKPADPEKNVIQLVGKD